jgi:hypothetical protein
MSSTTPLSTTPSAGAVLQLSGGSPHLRAPLSEQYHAAVLEYTQRIFGAQPSIRREADPEFGDEYFVVDVAPRGNEEEVLACWHEWHRDLHLPAKEQTHFYRLSLLPGE